MTADLTDDERAALTTLLTEWLPGRRWFAGKGQPIEGVEIVSEQRLADEPAALHHAALHHMVVAVRQGARAPNYQLLVGLRPAPLPERLEYAAIGPVGPVGQRDRPRVAYDAMHDPELTGVLLEAMAERATRGVLHFGGPAGEEIPTGLTSRVLTAEQSNTSVVFGDQLILKLFRQVAPGVNPDLEITRALAEVGSKNIARPLGWIEADPEVPGEPVTLAILQEFLPTASEGWDLAKASVRDLMAEGDLHADEVGGDFAGEAQRLGAATAKVHADLARVLPTALLEPSRVAALAAAMRRRLDEAVAEVPALVPYAPALGVVFDQLAAREAPLPVQRIHGDYHLGQVLRTPTGWVLLDFEGEPAKPLAERRALGPVARDVAGMLRSFDYASRHLLPEIGTDPQREYRANEWAQRNRDAFCAGYAAEAGTDPRDDRLVLRAFETDKAIYEVVYETRNRPSWLPIPMAAIERLVT